jgi:hypothetical protein
VINHRDTVEVVVHVPRAALAPATEGPVMVSQRTCERFGLSRRDYLEALRRPDCPVRVSRLGKLRLVDAVELRAWLVSLNAGPSTAAEPVDDADAVLRSLGLRAIQGGRR